MSEVQSPRVSGVVLFLPHPKKDAICGFNDALVLPAFVIQSFGELSVNLSIFTMNPDAPNVLRWSVPHWSKVQLDDDGAPATSYWKYPDEL